MTGFVIPLNYAFPTSSLLEGEVTKIIFVLVAMLGLFGCAGRAPAPVSVVQAQDRFMDCAAILAEVEANNAKVQQLASEQGLKVAQNVAAGVAGIVIPVLWFGMDWQGAPDKEIQALQARQQYLVVLAEQRQCGTQKPEQALSEPRKASKKHQ